MKIWHVIHVSCRHFAKLVRPFYIEEILFTARCDNCTLFWHHNHNKSHLLLKCFTRSFNWCFAWSSSYWLLLTQFSFYSPVNKYSMNFADMWCMLSFPVIIAWHCSILMYTSTLYQTVKWWSQIITQTALIISLFVDMESHPGL